MNLPGGLSARNNQGPVSSRLQTGFIWTLCLDYVTRTHTRSFPSSHGACSVSACRFSEALRAGTYRNHHRSADSFLWRSRASVTYGGIVRFDQLWCRARAGNARRWSSVHEHAPCLWESGKIWIIPHAREYRL